MALPEWELSGCGKERSHFPPCGAEDGLAPPNGVSGGMPPADPQTVEALIQSIREAVLELDDKGRVRIWNARARAMFGYTSAEAVGQPLAHLVSVDDEPLGPELARLLRRAKWPQPEHTVSGLMRRMDGTTFLGEMTLCAYQCGGNRRMLAVVREREEYLALEAALAASLKRERLALESLILAIGRVVEARDPYTAGHQQRTASLAQMMALEMGMSAERAEGIFLGAAIHDIGKIDVPAEILSRPTTLRPGEWEIIRRHPLVGYNILRDIAFPWPVADIALQHHEYMDGSGYPHGIGGANICTEARIVTVADAVEAISSHRPYRPARSMAKALAEINAYRGSRYDPAVVDVCTRLLEGKTRLEEVIH